MDWMGGRVGGLGINERDPCSIVKPMGVNATMGEKVGGGREPYLVIKSAGANATKEEVVGVIEGEVGVQVSLGRSDLT